MEEEKTKEKQTGEDRKTILVVDDEPSNVALTREVLGQLGYRVVTAGSGQEAVTVFLEHEQEIDMVILDLVMPGMGGGKTFDALRSINPCVKVLLSSGYSVDGEAKKILERGCGGFIQKPFRIAEISQKIKEVLGK